MENVKMSVSALETRKWTLILRENVRFTTQIQQMYNNPSHEGGSHILGLTLM